MQVELILTDVECDLQIALYEHPVVVSSQADSNIEYSFEKVIENYCHATQSRRMKAYSELYKLLSYCVKFGEKSVFSKNHTSISPAVNYIHNNYTKKINVQYLAELCNISASQLRRNFLSELGKTPLSYKIDLMIESICAHLENDELSINEIAYIFSFDDVYAFSHFFKKHKGISASEYRKTLK